jgi:hypothetical protein
MSECMLCQTRRAEHPYLIGSIGLRVYSVEELLYFIEHNIALLDETILNGDLVRWMKEELRMRRLAVNLSMVMQRKFSVREFVLPIFREVHYPDDETIRKIDEELKKAEEQPSAVRTKERGDALFRYGRYLLAIDEGDRPRRFVPGNSLAQHRMRARPSVPAGGTRILHGEEP